MARGASCPSTSGEEQSSPALPPWATTPSPPPRVEDKVGALRDRDQTIATLEAEIAEVSTQLDSNISESNFKPFSGHLQAKLASD